MAREIYVYGEMYISISYAARCLGLSHDQMFNLIRGLRIPKLVLDGPVYFIPKQYYLDLKTKGEITYNGQTKSIERFIDP